jgi:CYTH domain-containing protein
VRGRPKAYRRGMVETHSGMEIERKYLLRSQPDLSAPELVGAEEWLIEQTYLRGGARLRRIETGGDVSYVETVKTGRGLVRDERERVLDRKEYKKLLEQADPERQTIRKRRLRFEHGGQLFELDLFTVPSDLVLLEVELADEGEQASPPAFLGELVEVTGDERYENSQLALRR